MARIWKCKCKGGKPLGSDVLRVVDFFGKCQTCYILKELCPLFFLFNKSLFSCSMIQADRIQFISALYRFKDF